jgi:hypothetical protein
MPSRSFSADRVAAFRLARHHLTGSSTASLVAVCRDVCGIQAQVMSAAELSLWTRRRQTTRADEAALWTARDLVKTTSMRRTLHLLPAGDFQMYIAAMQAWSMSQTNNLLRRIGASTRHVDTMIDVVMDALADGPKTQQALLARAKVKASKGMRRWLQFAWSAMRPAILKGLIVYAEPRGGEATFVRVDQWLPKQKAIDPGDAQLELARRYLAAFGFVLRRDLAELSAATPASSPTLLPSFDTFLLAHAVKDHLVHPRFYKRVYRNQGWLSPVVIVNGRIVAVWFLEERAKSFVVDVQPFETLDAKVRRGIAQEAEALGLFLGERCDVQFA